MLGLSRVLASLQAAGIQHDQSNQNMHALAIYLDFPKLITWTQSVDRYVLRIWFVSDMDTLQFPHQHSLCSCIQAPPWVRICHYLIDTVRISHDHKRFDSVNE